jgi:hypothetical protein
MLNGARRNLYTNHVMAEDIMVTNVTAILMANACLVSLDIATKGHNPRKRDRITLFTKTAEIKIVRN